MMQNTTSVGNETREEQHMATKALIVQEKILKMNLQIIIKILHIFQ